jgi:hypothetical protein
MSGAPVPAYTTTDMALTENMMALLSQFLLEESAPLKAEHAAQTPEPTAEQAEFIDTLMYVAQELDHIIDAMMVVRLAANDRRIPLLQEADVDRVLAKFLDGQPMNNEMAALMALARPMVALQIATNVTFLSAIDANLYTGFWQFVQALVNEAVRSGATLMQVVQYPHARAAIYRSCMSHADWRKLTAARTAAVAGINSSRLLGGMGSVLNDEQALQLEAELAEIDARVSPEVAEKANRTKRFYTKRGREIWSAQR